MGYNIWYKPKQYIHKKIIRMTEFNLAETKDVKQKIRTELYGRSQVI